MGVKLRSKVMSNKVTTGANPDFSRTASQVISQDFDFIHGGYIGILEGEILTIIDATTQDQKQKEAIKSITRKAIWNWFERNKTSIEEIRK